MKFRDSYIFKPGEGKCGALCCLRCHQLIEYGKETEHACPQDKLKPGDVDQRTLALMKETGKMCPMCGNFVQKNGGCNTMLCGTNSHGKLRDALRNGGCGHQFYWDSL